MSTHLMAVYGFRWPQKLQRQRERGNRTISFCKMDSDCSGSGDDNFFVVYFDYALRSIISCPQQRPH